MFDRLRLCRWMLVPLAFSTCVLAAPGIAEARNCQFERYQCGQKCIAEGQRVTARAQDRSSEIEAANQSHKHEVEECKKLWQEGRNYWTAEYDRAMQECADAECRKRALHTYNVNFNGAAVGEVNCVEVANSRYSDRMDAIYDRYADIPDVANPGYHHTQDCHEECVEQSRECQADSEDSGDEAGMRLEPCPPGTEPSPLGICTVRLRSNPRHVPIDQEDCPPGLVRGPDDRCVPKLRVVGVVKSFGEWWLVCPEGTEPSPVDGACVPDLAPEGEWTPDPDALCPSGMEPGPEGGCVPTLPPNPDGAGPFYGSMPVAEPELAIELTRSLLEARRVETGSDGTW